VRRLFAIAAALTFFTAAWDAHAQSTNEKYDRNACSIHGGVKGISRPFTYIGYFLKWSVANDGISPCIQNCPQCIQYCYAYSVVCNDGAILSRYSQVKPFLSPFGEPPTYTSETQEQAEWAQIQAKEASTKFWRPLSPYPQFLILGCFIFISGVAWFGRDKRGTGIKDWGLNVPFNFYFALSLLTFNTSGDSSNLAQSLDGSVFFHSALFIIVICAFLAINAMSLARGWDYLFVKHPAADIVNSAVDQGTPIHGKSLVQALSTSLTDTLNLRPRWHYEHQAEKARKLSEKLDRDTELTRAAIVRERARAELQDEKQASADDLREQVWRGRTFK
jgi:hypothetical protein